MSSRIEHVAWSAPEGSRPGTTLVVALHGRGADGHSMVGLVERHYPGLGHGIDAEEMRDISDFVAGSVHG